MSEPEIAVQEQSAEPTINELTPEAEHSTSPFLETEQLSSSSASSSSSSSSKKKKSWKHVVNIISDLSEGAHRAWESVTYRLVDTTYIDKDVDELTTVLGNTQIQNESEIEARYVSWDGKKLKPIEHLFAEHKLTHAPQVAPLSIEEINADPHMPAIKKLLSSMIISSTFNSCVRLFTLSHKLKVPHALAQLATRNILSAPVLCSKGNVMGFLSVMDIIGFVMTEVLQSDKEGRPLDVTHIYAQKTIGELPHLRHVAEQHEPDHWFPLRDNDSVYRLFQAFSWGIHRVAVMHEENHEMINVLSQSDVIQLLATDSRFLGEKGNYPLSDPRSGFVVHPEKIVAVGPSTRTYVAFHHMYTHKISAVAVVDLERKFQGALSCNMIKGLQMNNIQLLVKPVLKFIEDATPSKIDLSAETGTLDMTMNDVVQKLAQSKKHRLWIVDEEQKLIGLLTLTDIIKAVVRIEPGDMS